MNRTTLGYLLIAGALTIELLQYYQEQGAIASGAIQPEQAIGITDRLFSPAGVALGVGVYLAWPSLKHIGGR